MSIMKVTVYKDGEIQREFEAVGFGKAMTAAMHLLCKETEKFAVGLQLDLVITTCHLSSLEWSACVECADDEIWGIHVGRA